MHQFREVIDGSGRLSTEYGVNTLQHFDMCSGTLLPDVMHDLLEGAVQHLLQLLVSYCIEKNNYFNLSLLNAKIEGEHPPSSC